MRKLYFFVLFVETQQAATKNNEGSRESERVFFSTVHHIKTVRRFEEKNTYHFYFHYQLVSFESDDASAKGKKTKK